MSRSTSHQPSLYANAVAMELIVHRSEPPPQVVMNSASGSAEAVAEDATNVSSGAALVQAKCHQQEVLFISPVPWRTQLAVMADLPAAMEFSSTGAYELRQLLRSGPGAPCSYILDGSEAATFAATELATQTRQCGSSTALRHAAAASGRPRSVIWLTECYSRDASCRVQNLGRAASACRSGRVMSWCGIC